MLSCFSHVHLFVTPWTVACQVPPSTGFPRQEYWSGWPFPSPGVFLIQGLNLGLQHCRQILYYLNHQGSPHSSIKLHFVFLFIQPESLCILIDIFNPFLLVWFLMCSALNLLCYYLFSVSFFQFFPLLSSSLLLHFPSMSACSVTYLFTILFTVT